MCSVGLEAPTAELTISAGKIWWVSYAFTHAIDLMNLLRLFEFYLMSMFVIGTVRRWELYHSLARLGLALVRRYQKLFGRVKDQSRSLLTWALIVPLGITLLLWLTQSILTRLVFPHAELLFSEVMARWWSAVIIGVPVLGMFAVDIYFLFRVGSIDAHETEKYFHQAESWLGTWKAKAVRVATMGYINPQKIVETEVGKALVTGASLIHKTLWWTALQTGLRVTVGLALWLVWAVGAHVTAS
jgi:hypothetical protein